MRRHYITATLALLIGCAAGMTYENRARGQATLDNPERGFAASQGRVRRWQQFCAFRGARDEALPYMAERGNEGWELVNTSPSGGMTWLMCFRRPVE